MYNAAINNYRKYRTLSIILSMLAAFGANAPTYADNECEHRSDNKTKATAFFDTHNTALHDQLGLTANQESAWKTFIAKLKADEHAGQTIAAEPADLTVPDHIDRKLAIMRSRLSHMESRAQAIEEFYGQLTAQQQHVFDEFFRTLRDRHKPA